MTEYLSSPRLSPLVKAMRKEKAKETKKASPQAAALIHIPLPLNNKRFG
jgi:hypothetical protein